MKRTVIRQRCTFAHFLSNAHIGNSNAPLPMLHAGVACGHVTRTSGVRANAKPGDSSETLFSLEKVLGAAVPAAGYATLLTYANSFAPNQTPLRDTYFIEKLVGLGVDDGFMLNPVLVSVFFLMGVYPIIFASLMIPSARCSKVPVWPFVSCSFALGVFALFPYLLFWDLDEDVGRSPPDQTELESGWGRFGMQALESWLLPASQVLVAGYMLFQAFDSGAPGWNEYFRLFDESKFVHVMSLDFIACTTLCPLFLWVDAQKRKWQFANIGVPLLSLLPLVGPLVYLILRPKTSKNTEVT